MAPEKALTTNAAYGARTAGARRDAQLIVDVLRATHNWSGLAGRDAVSKPIRELIWFVWEQPRLRQYASDNDLPLFRSKYPSWVPWSPGARRIHRQGMNERLVLEHVTPSRVIVQDLLARPPQTPAALIKILNKRLHYAVLSPEENQAISRARLGWKLVEGNPDPWARYHAAGLNRDSFRPIKVTP